MHSFKKWVMFASLAAAIALSHTAKAQDLDSMMGASTNQFSDNVDVACGVLTKANCALVLPKIAHYSVPQGVTISPIESHGSLQSAEAVCKGIIQSAIGQMDAFSLVENSTACASSFQQIGSPLYPYYGYLVVLASNPANSMDDLVNNVQQGQTLNVADGKMGSGGQVTFQALLAADPNWKRVVAESDEDQDSALGNLSDGTLDAYFVMDGPGSALVSTIKNSVDKNGNKVYKFLDISPDSSFFNELDFNGKPLYQSLILKSGWFIDTHTISTNAVLIVNTSWANGQSWGSNPADSNSTQAVNVLRQAQDQAEAAIMASTLTPPNWTGSVGQ